MMTMKKKMPLSLTSIIMLALLVVLVAYCFLFFLPAQKDLTVLKAELSVANAQADIYRQYLADVTPLENDIAAIQAEIDEMNSEAYTNDANVSFVISDAIQRYQIDLSSVSLDAATTFGDHRALPIHLTVSGEMNNILKFIAFFEKNEHGSFLVRGASLETNGTTTTANLLIYLCTPNQ